MAEIRVVLTDEAAAALQDIATSRGISLEEALKEALASERVIAREVANGSRILIKKADDSIRELIVA